MLYKTSGYTRNIVAFLDNTVFVYLQSAALLMMPMNPGTVLDW